MKKIKHLIHKICLNTSKKIFWVIFQLFYYKPNVMSKEETIKMILNNNLSISRFGDGELRLMIHRGDIGFQEKNDALSDALKITFNTRNDKLLICSFNFKNKWPSNTPAGKWLRRYVHSKYKDLVKTFDRSYIYGDTDITRFYNPSFYQTTNFDYLEKEYIPLLKKIWDGRKLLIVEGAETKLGLGNDLFDNASSIRRILCPPKNAWDSYNKIYESVLQNYEKNDLILIALGPTATILSRDITVNKGWQCIDVGHIDIVYLWFINKTNKKDRISGKYVNEYENNPGTIELIGDEKKYISEIICKID